jgi:uncharacterized iron-regulated protein
MLKREKQNTCGNKHREKRKKEVEIMIFKLLHINMNKKDIIRMSSSLEKKV